VTEKLRVSSHVQGSKQHVGEIELAGIYCEVHHVAPKQREICAQLARPPAGESDHLRTGVESEITEPAPVPFFQIGTGSRAQLKDVPYLDRRELADRRFEKVDLLAQIPEAERDLVVLGALVNVHVRIILRGSTYG